MKGIDQITELPLGAQIALGIAIIIQFTLMVTALIILARTPGRYIANLPKLIWAIVIILAQTIGPIVFLASAHRDKTAREECKNLVTRLERPNRSDVNGVIEQLYLS